MPSHLRLQSAFEAVPVEATYQTSPTPPQKKQKMSLTQTYYVASTARSKLGREANRPDHDLRLLVGHANLLDNLMLELADAEREEEAWFNQSVKKASKPEEPRHIQWIDRIAEEVEEDDSDSDSESEDEYEEDAELYSIPIRKVPSPPILISSQEFNDSEELDEAYDEDYDEEHALTRVASKHSPPELTLDDSDSEDESMPSSPKEPALEYSEKERQQLTTTAFYDANSQHELEDFIMMQPPRKPLVATY